ncbi:MAG: hypothetical protein WKG07_21870 [Hymenobacter sp.]
MFDTDEQPRISTLEKLATLRPAFQPDGGTVTAGNSAGINDGAAAALLVNDEALARYNLKPMVANRGVGRGRGRPLHHGHGPGTGHPQGAGARRPHPGRYGPAGAERGVCLAEPGRDSGAGSSI